MRIRETLFFPPKFRLIFVLFWIVGISYVYNEKHLGLLTIDVEMSSSTSGIFQLFADDGRGFRENLSTHQQVNSSRYPVSYHLELPLPNGIKALRLDPIDSPGKIYIQRVVITYNGKKINLDGDKLSELQILHHLKSYSGDQKVGRSFQVEGSDPILLFNLPDNFTPNSVLERFAASFTNFLPSYKGWMLIFIGLLLVFLLNIPEFWQTPPLSNSQPFYIGAVLVPISLFWILYHQTLWNWFSADDPCHLVYLLEKGIWSSFFDPVNGGSLTNFTPLFFLSFGIDLKAFGLEPHSFYWHHLISFTLSIILVYFVLIQFLSPIAAIFTLNIFITSVASADAVNLLMERHYIEGLGLSAAAILFFLYAVRRNLWGWSAFGSFIYLFAALAKELYVPLVVLLPFLPLNSWSKRIRMVLPYTFTFGLYMIWRAYMLGVGKIAKGYSHIEPTSWEDILRFPINFLSIMKISWIHSAGIGCGLILFIWVIFKNKPKLIPLAVLATLAVCLPFFPVLPILSSRYVFVFTLLLYVAIFFGFQYMCYFPKGPVGLALAGFLLLISNINSVHHYQNALSAWLSEFRARGQFILQSSRHNDVMMGSAHCIDAYLILRERLSFDGQGTIVRNEDELCNARYAEEVSLKAIRFFEYSKGEMVERKLEELSANCVHPFLEKKLWIEIIYSPEKHEISWEVGPYPASQGEYFLVGEGIHEPFYLKKNRGHFTFTFHKPLKNIRLFYKDAEGWQTASPSLMIDLSKIDKDGSARFEWRNEITIHSDEASVEDFKVLSLGFGLFNGA